MTNEQSDTARPARPLRRYSITVQGYDPHEVLAPTSGAAKYQDYVAYCDACGRIPFREFLERVSMLCLGVAS